ncbi:MAG: transposase [Nitrospirae bacterium]|nr:transposase [Nitrospirota bacterium]
MANKWTYVIPILSSTCTESVSGIVHVGCWAHARRKFVEVIEAQPKNKRRARPYTV